MKGHGAFARIRLACPGSNGPNLYSNEAPLAPGAMPIGTFTNDPVQARALDRTDIRNLSHRAAACRTLEVDCIRGITASHEGPQDSVTRSIGIVTALTPHTAAARHRSGAWGPLQRSWRGRDPARTRPHARR